MKWLRSISAIVLVLVLTAAVIPFAAFAEDGNVSYEGGAEKFIFKPGTDLSETSLFPDFEGAMPGDTLTQEVQVVNNSSSSDYVKIYLRADPHDAESNPLATDVAETEDEVSMTDFLAQLHMTVENNGEIIFDSSPDQTDGLTENVLLGTFKKGEGTTLTVTLEVPIELGNEYANRRGEVDWVFTVEEYDTNPHITVEKTITSQPKDSEGYAKDEEITYNIKVTNDGDVDVKDIVVKDDLTGDEWSIALLKVGASANYTATYKVTEQDVKNGSVVNVVTVEGTSSFDDDPVKDDDEVPAPTKPEPTPTPPPNPPVRTGDPSKTALYGVLMLASVIGVITVIVLGKKRQNK